MVLVLGVGRFVACCWAWAALVLLGVGSSASDGPCAARSVRVRRRAAMTRSDGVDGRYAQRYEQRFEPVAWLGVEAK